MKLRSKLFLAQIVTLGVVLAVILIPLRSVAIEAIYRHMATMKDGSALMADHLKSAVTGGVNEAILIGTLVAVVAASVVSLAASRLLTRPLEGTARVAERIASGSYSQRVEYHSRDEIGHFVESFNDMAVRLEETEMLRRQMLGTISHELRTPLANIQGYLEGLIEGIVPPEPVSFQLIHGESVRLSRLVGDIERLSRLDAGIEQVQPRSVSPTLTLRRVCEGMRPQFERKDVALEVESREHLPHVWADPDRLSQVLVNLLTNALTYTPRGGIVRVSVSAHEAHSLLFVVADSGIGIPEQDLSRVFERFYRVDKSRSTAGGGSGIGLAVVKALVEQMGGEVWAESAPGEGATFSFSLPATEAVIAERRSAILRHSTSSL